MIERTELVKEVFSFMGIDDLILNSRITDEKVNAYDGPYQVDKRVVDALKKHFIPHNKELETILNIDLSLWSN
jgi:hypothetical protein